MHIAYVRCSRCKRQCKEYTPGAWTAMKRVSKDYNYKLRWTGAKLDSYKPGEQESHEQGVHGQCIKRLQVRWTCSQTAGEHHARAKTRTL